MGPIDLFEYFFVISTIPNSTNCLDFKRKHPPILPLPCMRIDKEWFKNKCRPRFHFGPFLKELSSQNKNI